ncbi:B-cell receptor CD22-like [Archocentrus centrarchus]|uniref:B-cell receptor CD22-like n=1 Tax=Archocentrus centrarchus TaxID=63155 RepID=UPI0011EA0A58|nr:B-cell receptor CD22-like [Archocentrus centrarchus]
MNWFAAYRGGSKIEPSADETHRKYSMSADSRFTLTINSLTESDANIYCCRETADKPDDCQQSGISLRVTELQVKVIPATEGQTVTLMCSSSSCPLTENPAAYIWYKNREFLYEDWSPWYQELLSSEEAVTYSCAVKGYEHLRAPELSVDSITPTCFNVTHAKGEMCSSQQPCSITYPREVHVVRTSGNTLTCSTTCLLTDPQTDYVWFRNGQKNHENQRISTQSSLKDNFYCAVKGVQDKNCWRVNYVSRRICALEGSSVNIISEYSHPENMKPENKFWSKTGKGENMIEPSGRVEYHDNMKNQHILTIKNLTKNDSGGYTFRLRKEDEELKQSDQPGVILIVTELRVEMSPSAVVTEGQRVTLTCRTSCPLTHNTNYIWYFNNQPVTLTEAQNKHLILDPVSRENVRNYSCAVEINKHGFTGKWLLGAAGASAALLLIIIILLTVCCCRRKKRTSSHSPRSEIPDSKQEVTPNPIYENISAQYNRMQATMKHQTDPYSHTADLYTSATDIYSNTDDLYSNIVELYSNTASPSFN